MQAWGSRSSERRCSAPRAAPGRCRREQYTGLCAHVGMMLTDFLDEGMLYDVWGGQGRRNSGL